MGIFFVNAVRDNLRFRGGVLHQHTTTPDAAHEDVWSSPAFGNMASHLGPVTNSLTLGSAVAFHDGTRWPHIQGFLEKVFWLTYLPKPDSWAQGAHARDIQDRLIKLSEISSLA